MKITVLGAGLVGRTIAMDLNRLGTFVTSVDASADRLRALPCDIHIEKRDLSCDFGDVLKDADLVVNALPGFLGYNAMKQIIGAKKNVVDISFFKEDPFSLDELAVKNGVCAVVDCGVAPGMCNIIFGYLSTQYDVLDSYECYVGGVPFHPVPPFNYKAPFSPDDVIEFIQRPARFVVDGKLIVKPALTDVEPIETPVGTLELFNTDGLRSLLDTMNGVPNMVEKTIRYPGYAHMMSSMRDLGFFEEAAMPVTTKMLKDAWALGPEEDEFTFMKVIVSGLKSGKKKTMTYTVYDKYDPETGFSSMSRTTGFTANAVVNLMLDGVISLPGIHAPEMIGKDGHVFEGIIKYLADRNVVYKVVED